MLTYISKALGILLDTEQADHRRTRAQLKERENALFAHLEWNKTAVKCLEETNKRLEDENKRLQRQLRK